MIARGEERMTWDIIYYSMDEALSEIEFLSRSENRVLVLERLAENRYTRGELGKETDASQATLGRISRILRNGHGYDMMELSM
jgi:hypothetical protein